MGNKNGAIGSIDHMSESTFSWSLQDIKKLVSVGDQSWRDSPSFFYKHSWCLQVHPHLDGNSYVAFRLRLTTKAKKMDIKYHLLIFVPYQGIVWDSSLISDSFGAKEDFGMLVTLKKSFIDNVVLRSADSFSLQIQFQESWTTPPDMLLQAPLLSLSASEENLFNCEIMNEYIEKLTRKEKVPQKGKKKASFAELRMLASSLGKLFRSGDGSDVIVKSGNKAFPAHKTVLMARSKVFRRMLELDMAEKRNGVIQIDDSNPDSVEKLLSHLYTGDLPDLKEEEVVELFILAYKYDLPSLVEHCRDHILGMLNTDNFFELFKIGISYVDQKIEDFCRDFFKENLKTIVKTENWRVYMIENPSLAFDLIAKSV